jgi:vitamin B12/bleomycin/antimicrobial peptide transport system ATP-binding/permease protein
MVSLDAVVGWDAVGRIEIAEADGDTALIIRLVNLSVTLEDGTAVVDEAKVSIMPGERVLVADGQAPGGARWSAPSPVISRRGKGK